MEAQTYPWIVKWGTLLGSNFSFIEGEIQQAIADGAPLTATYRKHDGTWSTIDDISNPRTREQLGLTD